MAVHATAKYTLYHAESVAEEVEISVDSDAGYSPDIASDLVARVWGGLIEACAEIWPPVTTP